MAAKPKSQWTPEAQSRFDEAKAARHAAAKKARPRTVNRCLPSIDRGNTLAELRRAWGIQ